MPAELLERDGELATCAGALRDGQAARGGLVLIEGPPGVGKTQLLASVTERARGDGMRVLSARAAEGERAFAFGVIRQLLRPLRGDPQLFEGAAALAQPAVESGSAEPGDATLHGLFWLFAGLAERRPLALFVDDLHWADDGSRAALEFLARRIDGVALTLALAARPAEPGAPPGSLDALAGEPSAHRLRPRPLSREAVATLVRARLGAPDAAFVDACLGASAGNPFMLGELLAELGDTAPSAAAAPVVADLRPDGVMRALRRRLARLRSAEAALARAVAILGDGTPRAHVLAFVAANGAGGSAATAAEAGGEGDGHGVSAEVELERLGILVAGEEGPAFAHPLVRSAVEQLMPPSERAALHARAAAQPGVDDERAALHLLHVPPHGDERAAAVLHAAGLRALDRAAPSTAALLLSRALAEPPPADSTGAVELALGRALLYGGAAPPSPGQPTARITPPPTHGDASPHDTAPPATRATPPPTHGDASPHDTAPPATRATPARTHGDTERHRDSAPAARATPLLATRSRPARLDSAAAAAEPHLEAALERAATASDRATAATLLARGRLRAGDLDAALAALDRGLELVDGEETLSVRLGAERLVALRSAARLVAPGELAALQARATGLAEQQILLGLRSIDEIVLGESAAAAITAASGALAGTPPAGERSAARIWAGLALVLADALVQAETHFSAEIADAQRRGSAFELAVASCWRGMARWRRGDLAGAEEDCSVALDSGIDVWMGGPAACGTLIEVHTARGELAAAHAVSERAQALAGDASMPDDFLRSGRAALALAEGRPAEALAHAYGSRDHMRATLDTGPGSHVWEPAAVAALLALGRTEEAAALARTDLQAARRFGAPWRLGLALRVAALTDPTHHEEAIAVLRAAGGRLELARALLARGDRPALAEALELAQACGATALERDAHARLVASGALPRRPRQIGPLALTAAERRVARLAAAGRSNPEIAAALFVSAKTVEKHLTASYRKLGVRSRSQLHAVLGEPAP